MVMDAEHGWIDYSCSKCGKLMGHIHVSSPDKAGIKSAVCSACRDKMKKVRVTYIVYEDGFSEISGACDFCGQFPCEHVSPDGTVTTDFGGYTVDISMKKQKAEKDDDEKKNVRTIPAEVRLCTEYNSCIVVIVQNHDYHMGKEEDVKGLRKHLKHVLDGAHACYPVKETKRL